MSSESIESIKAYLPRRYHNLVETTISQYEDDSETRDNLIGSLTRAIPVNSGSARIDLYLANLELEAEDHRNNGRYALSSELDIFVQILNEVNTAARKKEHQKRMTSK